MDAKKTINFLRGVPAEEALSNLIPLAAEGYEKVIRIYGTEVLQYGHFVGFKPLRELIGGIHQVHPDRVIIGNGGLEVISLFFKSLPRESRIIVEEASYDRVLTDLGCYGHQLLGVRLSSDGVDINHFQELADQGPVTAFYGIPFHQNPTGIIYSEANRKHVEQICREKNIFCLWDICYQDLRYDGIRNIPIEVSDWGPLLTSSFTKTISPGTKCGYMIVPLDYVGHFSKIIANTRINPNLPTQAFIADFMESGKYLDYLQYLCRLYQPRMEALNTSLQAHFPGAYPAPVTGGFFSTLTFPTIQKDNEAAFLESAKAAGVGLSPAWEAISPDRRDEWRLKGLLVRVAFPALSVDDIALGLSRLNEAVKLYS